MPPANRLSSIDLLPDDLRDAIDKAIADGRSTIDQILAHLQTIAPPDVDLPSRSALGRYKKREEAALTAMGLALKLGDKYAQKYGEDPKGDVGQLVSQLLKVRIYQSLMSKMEAEPVDDESKELALLARATREATESELKSNVLQERRHAQKQCKAALDKVEAEAATNPDMDKSAMLKRIREEIYGVFQ